MCYGQVGTGEGGIMEEPKINFLHEYGIIMRNVKPGWRKASLQGYCIGTMATSLDEIDKKIVLDLLRDEVMRTAKEILPDMVRDGVLKMRGVTYAF